MPRQSRLPRAGLPPQRDQGWVALSGSGPVGKGLTADDARATAKLSRSKELAQVIFFPTDSTQPLELPPIFDRVRGLLPDPSRVWLVGGSVRDALLRRPMHDLDFAVAGDGLAIARSVANRLNAAYYPLDESRRTGRAVVREGDEQFFLDFASLRGDDLNADLAGRDFTVNAIAVSLSGQLIDPMGGQADLKAKRLRQCHPASIESDPVRALRAIRLAAQLDFHIERGTRDAARNVAPLIDSVAAERVRDEFMKMLGGRRVAASLRAMDALGLLARVVPETAALKGVTQSAPHVYDVWEHTLAVVDHLERLLLVLGRVHDVDAASEYALGYAAGRVGRYRIEISDHLDRELSVGRATRCLLFFAALMHDIAKPLTRTVEANGRVRFFDHEVKGAEITEGRAIVLRLSADEVARVAAVVQHHMRPVLLALGGAVTPRAVYRFFRDADAAGVDVCLLTLADLLGTRGVDLGREEWATRVDTVVALLDGYYRQLEKVVRPPALITGEDVMALGEPQGKRVGQLLEAVREAQAAGEVSTREEAIELVKRLCEKGSSTDGTD
ncbi:MAG TPA: HD domain-containing protein [Anaerolineales bacterium]|nr:HD domain-containing protein [Anaerolineales bacterium]